MVNSVANRNRSQNTYNNATKNIPDEEQEYDNGSKGGKNNSHDEKMRGIQRGPPTKTDYAELDGQEEEEEKNPNRVEGGKNAAQTRSGGRRNSEEKKGPQSKNPHISMEHFNDEENKNHQHTSFGLTDTQKHQLPINIQIIVVPETDVKISMEDGNGHLSEIANVGK